MYPRYVSFDLVSLHYAIKNDSSSPDLIIDS